MRPRQECDVRETRESYEQCGAVPAPRRPEQRCRSQVRYINFVGFSLQFFDKSFFKVREVPREVCRDTLVVEARKVCEKQLISVPSVTCETKLKQIEIKVVQFSS